MVNKTTNKTTKSRTKAKQVVEPKFGPFETAKSIFKSRTFWINFIGFVSVFLENQYGFGIDPGVQLQILAFVNIILRTITKEPVVWRKPKSKFDDEEY